MSLSFASAPGNLFNRLGKIGLLIKNLSAYQALQLTSMTDTTNGVVAQYNSESDVQAIMGSAYIGILNGSGGNVGGVCQSLAASTINRMVFRDNPRFNQTLQAQNVTASIQEVIRQMGLAGATVLAMTVAVTPGTITGTGTGFINASIKRPLDGRYLENAFAENLLFTCVSDSYSGGAVAGNEGFQVNGVGAQTDPFAFNYPLGSNCLIQINAINAAADNSQGNLLTNSSFENFTDDVPDNWELTSGTGGVNIFEEDTIVYDDAPNKSVRVLGNGTSVTFKQVFDNGTDGTPGAIDPQTQYSLNLMLCRDGIAPNAGTLTVSLVDENNTVIVDMASTPNTTTIDLTQLSTDFASYKAVFRTPAILPTSVYLLYNFSSLETGRSVYLDFMSFGTMTQTYTVGAFVAVHAGNVPFLAGDYGTCAVTNSRGSGGTLSTWQTLFAQLFPDMMNYGFLLPSSATPSISDGLIG